MSILEVKFNSKNEFAAFVKNAAKRKAEYMEARRNGASQKELSDKGFQTLTFA